MRRSTIPFRAYRPGQLTTPKPEGDRLPLTQNGRPYRYHRIRELLAENGETLRGKLKAIQDRYRRYLCVDLKPVV